MKKNDRRITYLMKNTAIFAIGNIASRFITFLLVPLYTNVLNKSEYGTVDLINTVSTVLAAIIVLNIGESILRFSLDKDADNNKIMSIGFAVLFGGGVLGLLIMPVLKYYTPLAPYLKYLYLYMFTLAASTIFLCNLRGQEKLIAYSIGNILHTLLIAIFNIIYLVVLKKGVRGYFLAYIISNTITVMYAAVVGKCFKTIKNFSIDNGLLKDMVKYSIILIPNTFMWWIINSSDRVMITSLIGIAANGLYAVSYKLPTILSSITEIFNRSWMFSAIKENDSGDISEYSNRIYGFLFAFVSVAATAAFVVIKPFMRIYVGKSYYEAWVYIPYLIVGFVFLTMSTFLSNTYIANKDSKRFLISSSMGAVTNIVLNAILIPFIKIHGAALATCISYIVIFIYRVVSVRRYIAINAFKKKYMCAFFLLLLTAFSTYASFKFGGVLLMIELILMVSLFIPEWNILLGWLLKKLKRR